MVLSIILIALYVVMLSLSYNPVWVIVILSTGIIYGSLSSIVALRKLYFLAGASPHVALLAVTLAIPTYHVLGGNSYIYAFIYGLALIYVAGYMIHRGVKTDIATSLLVGATAALTVIAIYYVLTIYPLEYTLSAIILGDPLLTNWADAIVSTVLAMFTFTLIYLTYHEQLSIGIDRVSTVLSGIRIKIYDLLAYTLIGIGVVGLLKVTGYILEHILLLLPPGIAVLRARGAWEAFTLTMLIAVSSSLLGLHLALLINQAPSGIIGLLLLTFYMIAYLGGRR